MRVPAHFFHMRVRAHFSNRWQRYERIMSAKIRVQNSKFYMLGNFLETICWEISWKLYAWKFLGNHMMEIWKLYAGNLLMETMCWEIRMDASSFLKGVIMAQCYGITLQFQGNGTRGSVEYLGSTELFRTKQSEASEVIGSVKQGDGDKKPSWLQSPSTVGKHYSIKAKRVRL